jgi:hypothetical protein
MDVKVGCRKGWDSLGVWSSETLLSVWLAGTAWFMVVLNFQVEGFP